MSRVAEISAPVRSLTTQEARQAGIWCADQALRTEDPADACRTALYALGLKPDPYTRRRSPTNPSKVAGGQRKEPT